MSIPMQSRATDDGRESFAAACVLCGLSTRIELPVGTPRASAVYEFRIRGWTINNNGSFAGCPECSSKGTDSTYMRSRDLVREAAYWLAHLSSRNAITEPDPLKRTAAGLAVRLSEQLLAAANVPAGGSGTDPALAKLVEKLLLVVEPVLFDKRKAIDDAVRERQRSADAYNAGRSAKEPWTFIAEFRRSLERELEPLEQAVREVNGALDVYEATRCST